MLIIYQKRLQDFAKKHADAVNSIATWRKVVQEASWKRCGHTDGFPQKQN